MRLPLRKCSSAVVVVALGCFVWTTVALVAALHPTLVTLANPTPSANALFGLAVTGTGDLNGDGVGDLAVGAPGTERVSVISGAT